MNTVMQRHGISESLRGNREGELSGDLVEGTRGFLILAELFPSLDFSLARFQIKKCIHSAHYGTHYELFKGVKE